MNADPLLQVRDLRVRIATEDGVVQAVNGVSFDLHRGQTLGIVGESGSGKSVAALSLLGLTAHMSATVTGRAVFGGRDLLSISDRQLRSIRGDEIAMIFQDPLASLHPLKRVGAQIVEAIRVHRDVSRADARMRTRELMGLVGIPDPARRIDQYPHEYSGGMRQRAMIAMALANEPQVLIADEPTTALDVTVQAQILALLERLQRDMGMAILIITHDLGVLAQVADEVAVMYAGGFVEQAPVKTLFADPHHPYTWGLLGSLPRIDSPEGHPLVAIAGHPPSLIHPPTGCRFHPRCQHSRPECPTAVPPMVAVPGDDAHLVACVLEPATRARIWHERREAGALVGASSVTDSDRTGQGG